MCSTAKRSTGLMFMLALSESIAQLAMVFVDMVMC